MNLNMDNLTYDVLDLTKGNSNETYSTLGTFPTKANQSQKAQAKISTTDPRKIKKKDVPKEIKLLVLLITIVTVILSIITFASAAMSIATYSRLNFQLTEERSQFDETDIDIVSVLNQFSMSVQLRNLMLIKPECGQGLWWKVAYLNMSDPSQQCPLTWREYNISGVRACGRPDTKGYSCEAISYYIGRQYSRVCGRVIGYQHGSPDAFRRIINNDIDFDGINITYGVQRNHIWSYVAGVTQSDSVHYRSQCPCAGGVSDPPTHLHNNYYCESGNPDSAFVNKLYVDDPLWDGQQCEGTCCNGTNSPPWFSVQLPTPTTDGVEVSTCCDQSTDDEDVPVTLIEIFVQ